MTAADLDSTHEPSGEGSDAEAAPTKPEPGLVLICLSGQPALGVIPLGVEAVDIGRGLGPLSDYPDNMMSRRHAQVTYRGGLFEIADLGSRNGTWTDGVALRGTRAVSARTLVRFGHSLFLCAGDVRPFRLLGVKVEGERVEGHSLQQTLRTVAQLGQASRTLFISGESGAGKECIAQAFHRASPQRKGAFVAVNCAAIPEGIAERLLFGARKGAFSGASADSEGYIEAAHGGTLFLDEIADLDPIVQGKLLRVIESGELLPVGATRPRRVQFGVCSATHKDLRALVEASRFRADLYFRIGMPQVSVPALRQRKEEIPWLILKAVQTVTPGMKIDVSLVEVCALREWPGNVRELQAEIHTAALTARAAGDERVTAKHLRAGAGAAIQLGSSIGSQTGLGPMPVKGNLEPLIPMSPTTHAGPRNPMGGAETDVLAAPGFQPKGQQRPESSADVALPSRAQVMAALIESDGNISAAARAVSVHRTQFRRLLARYNIDLERLRTVGKL